MKMISTDVCQYVTCLGMIVSVVLLVVILVKQKPCNCGNNEGYREYSGGFSGTTANGYLP